mgnify:CR=1 FL=1
MIAELTTDTVPPSPAWTTMSADDLADHSTAEALAIRLELIANLPSPDACREQRREIEKPLEAAGDDTGGARFVTGLRLWF